MKVKMKKGLFRVKKEFIYRHIKIAVVVSVLSLLAFYIFQYHYLLKMSALVAASGGEESELMLALIEEQKYIFTLVLGGTCALSLTGIFIGGLSLANKIIKPLEKLGAHFEGTETIKQAKKCKVNRKEPFHELFSAYNKMVVRQEHGKFAGFASFQDVDDVRKNYQTKVKSRNSED